AARPHCREVRDRRQRRADLGDVDEHLAGNAAEVVLAPGHRAERLDPAERDRGDQVCDQTDRPVDRRRRGAPQGGAEPGRVPLLRVRVARAGHDRTLALVGRSRSPAATVAATATQPPPDDDRELLGRLRAGDEAAFATLVEKYWPSLLRVALLYVPSRSVAEEVVADTWLA